jgi:hypothetical protein
VPLLRRSASTTSRRGAALLINGEWVATRGHVSYRATPRQILGLRISRRRCGAQASDAEWSENAGSHGERFVDLNVDDSTRALSRRLAKAECRSRTLACRLGTANDARAVPKCGLRRNAREKRQSQAGLGTSRSLWAISSIDTSRKVRTLALFTKRAGRYMSQTQASPMETS